MTPLLHKLIKVYSGIWPTSPSVTANNEKSMSVKAESWLEGAVTVKRSPNTNWVPLIDIVPTLLPALKVIVPICS